MHFENDRVRFRALELADLAALRGWINDPGTAQFLSISWPVSSSAQADWFRRQEGRKDARKLAIETLDGALIGMLGLMGIDYQNGTVEVGITLDPEARGRGLASSSIQLALHVLFEHYPMHRVYAQILEPNAASLKLFESAGFTRDGLLRENTYWNGQRVGTHILSVLRTDWEQR